MSFKGLILVALFFSSTSATDPYEEAHLDGITVDYHFTVFLENTVPATPAMETTTEDSTPVESTKMEASTVPEITATGTVETTTIPDTSTATEIATSVSEDSTTVETNTASTEEQPTTTDISESTTAMNPETTSSAMVTDEVINELKLWLEQLYKENTTGFIEISSIGVVDTSVSRAADSIEQVDYTVVYNLTKVDDADNLAITEDSSACDTLYNNSTASFTGIQVEFCGVALIIVDSNWNDSTGDWYIEDDATEAAMTDDIEQVGADVADTCSRTTSVTTCSANYTCHMNSSGLSCMEKCYHFQTEEGHCNEDFLTESQCILIGDSWDPYPYCDCGSWALMDDWYDGHQCVSASFIVGMSAGLGALIIVILLSVIAGLSVSNSNKAKQLEERLYDDEISSGSAYNNKQSTYNTYTGWNGQPQQEMTETTPTNLAYENQAYEPVTPTEKPDDDPYKEFHPRLDHIDTTADYSIKRPHVMRPTDGTYSSVSHQRI